MNSLITMPAAFAAKEALLADLLSPSLLQFTSEGELLRQQIVANPFFHNLDGVEDIQVAHLPGPVGNSALLVKGRQGAHRQRISMSHQITIYVLSGQLLLWLPDQQQTPYVFQAGQCTVLAANLEHGFVVATDCLLYNVYTPAFDLVFTPIPTTS